MTDGRRQKYRRSWWFKNCAGATPTGQYGIYGKGQGVGKAKELLRAELALHLIERQVATSIEHTTAQMREDLTVARRVLTKIRKR